MVDFEITGTTVTVHVRGAHRVLSLCDHITFDLANIVAVEPAEIDRRPPWVRAPGVFFPGAIAAGTFRGKGRKEYWDTLFGGHAVRIDLRGHDYTRLVVDVDDLDAAIGSLRHAAAA
ncbi:hypothetical protein [Nocardia testacea]|uniref:hypothetical protein n=1 Tax=Nocardia testacea TaxID=248551 RepID=UPI00030D1DE1|nr:hypothetical protein [Nocardia testacea]